jgi:FG-GAP repeat
MRARTNAILALTVAVVAIGMGLGIRLGAAHSHASRLAADAARGAGARPAGSVAAALPDALRSLASSTLGSGSSRFAAARHGEVLRTTGGGITGTFSPGGARLTSGAASLLLSLAGGGRVAPVGTGNQVRFAHPGVVEWYRNGPLGLEQGFRVTQRPAADTGSLKLSIRTSGSLTPELRGAQIVFSGHRGQRLDYGGLSAVDAAGHHLASRLGLDGSTIQLTVDDAGARYPVTVDPFIQQGTKLVAQSESGAGNFGWRAAVSADGNTAIFGAPYDTASGGAAFVFTRTAGAWSQQQKLTVPGGQRFGWSVGLSGDGFTAIVGDIFDGGGIGAAYIFSRSNNNWIIPSGGKLIGSGAQGTLTEFGTSVALSNDGSTALIGGSIDNFSVGAVWTFQRQSSSYSQLGSKLLGTGESGQAGFGNAVALSADGLTGVVGGSDDNFAHGAVWFLTRPNAGTGWTQQKVAGTGFQAEFGKSVALSGDGGTALIGADSENNLVGAAWPFLRSGSTFVADGPALVPAGIGTGEYFGHSVALSNDGQTALVGTPYDQSNNGAVWIYTRSGATWTQRGGKLAPSDGSGSSNFSDGLALSADGSTAVISGHGDNASGASGTGAAWVFGSIPSSQFTVSPAAPDGRNGWYVSPVHVTVSASDLSSAALQVRCALDPASAPASFFTLPNTCAYGGSGADITGDGRHLLYAASANAGGYVEPAPQLQTVQIDRSRPTVKCTPAPMFLLHGRGGLVSARVSDPTSGPAAPIVAGAARVGKAGGFSVTLTGSNSAGLTAVVHCRYSVLAPRLRSSIQYAYSLFGSQTEFTALTAARVPPGGKVSIACAGGGCPFGHRSLTAPSTHKVCSKGKHRKCRRTQLTSSRAFDLEPFFRGHRLSPGANVNFTISKAYTIGAIYQFTMRAGSAPRTSSNCLAPGSSKPGKGCHN